MKKKYLVGWRVSTDEQKEEGYSVEDQIRRCSEYVKKVLQGEILEVIGDQASGTKIDRPGLSRIRDLLSEKKANGVVWMRADRMTRSLVHSLTLREESINEEYEIHFVNVGIYDSSPQGKMQADVEAMFSEFWRARIQEDTIRGKVQKIRSGKPVSATNLPYGYKLDEGGYAVLDDVVAKVVEYIFATYLSGYKAKAIADALNDAGHIPPGVYRGTGGKQTWMPETVLGIIRNQAYTGTLKYAGKSFLKLSNNEKLYIKVPQIITIETFDQAKRMRAGNKSLSKRNSQRFYVLSGMIKCGHCGYTMRAHPGRREGDDSLYRCPGTTRGVDCNGVVREQEIFVPVWESVVNILTNDEVFERGISEMEVRLAEKSRKTARETRHTLSAIEKVEKEIEKLVSSISSIGGAVGAAIENRIRELNNQHGKLSESLSVSNVEVPADIPSLREIRERVGSGLFKSSKNPEAIREIFQKMDLSIVYYSEGTADIFCNLYDPFGIDISHSAAIHFKINYFRLESFYFSTALLS